MKRDIIFAPSLIAADWWRVREQIEELTEAGCQWLHFDAMDGHFVPNLTLGPLFLENLRRHSPLHFDAHLMIANPAVYLNHFIDAGADSVSVHVEGNPHLHRLVEQIKDKGKMAGVVLNPATPLHTLDTILPEIHYVLVMSVDPGFGGQPFLPLAVPKIEQLRRLREERGLDFLIQVDGGINPQTAPDVVRVGADVLVCGSSLFSTRQPLRDNVRDLHAALAEAQS